MCLCGTILSLPFFYFLIQNPPHRSTSKTKLYYDNSIKKVKKEKEEEEEGYTPLLPLLPLLLEGD